MADIFFQGKIYIGVLPTYPESDYEVLEHTQYKRYIVTGSHSFKDRQDVTGLFELQHQRFIDGKNIWANCEKVEYDNISWQIKDSHTRIIALPIQQAVEKERGWTRNEAVSTPQEQMAECYFTPDKKTTHKPDSLTLKTNQDAG